MKRKALITCIIITLFFTITISMYSVFCKNSKIVSASSEIFLYTGGGIIEDSDYEVSTIGSKYYTSNLPTSVSLLPKPTINGDDENVKFEGWYSDAKLTKKATTINSGSSYYAKWVRTKTSFAGDYIFIILTATLMREDISKKLAIHTSGGVVIIYKQHLII